MAAEKAPRWLTQAFALGVDERRPPGGVRLRPPYPTAYPNCFLARHDERRRPCSGRIERFHFINRQRVEAAMAAQLLDAVVDPCDFCAGAGLVEMVEGDERRNRWCPQCRGGGTYTLSGNLQRELVLLAAWDPRNAEVGCEGHHRRFDSHLTPALTVPYSALPASVVAFAFGQGIDGELNRFPSSI